MNLSEEIINKAGDQMAKDIDTQVLLSALGWTSIKLKRFNDGIEAVDIIEWIDTNCTGEWKNLGTRFIFEKKQDAEWFSLRWE
jgi:uncharacterized membrane-anchored protein